MGLRQTLKDAVDAIFSGLGDIPDTITYVKVSIGGYDPDTDAQTRTTTNVSNVKVIVYNGKDIEQDSVWRMTSAQSKHTNTDETYMLIAASDLGNYTPLNTDYVVYNGDKYEIFGKVPVPTNPCWILRVRKV